MVNFEESYAGRDSEGSQLALSLVENIINFIKLPKNAETHFVNRNFDPELG